MAYDFYRLNNGVRVVLVPMSGVQSAGVGVYVETGSRYETGRINGISHFLEHMVFKGTKKFPSHEQTSYLEGLGAIQNAWTDVDATAYWCKIPADRWMEGLELVKELALYPLFPAKDLEIERGVILEEINRREDRPDEIVGEVLQGMLFPKNTLGMTVLGKPEVIKAVTVADFQDYHKQQYAAGRLVVAIAGKIEDVDTVKAQIEAWFEVLPAEAGKTFDPVTVRQSEPMVEVYRKDLAQQAHIELAVRGMAVSDPRRFASMILTTYLGRGLSSRLFIELREKRGLCYAVRAAEERWVDTGVWSVYAGLSLDKLEDAVSAILGEMERMTEVKLTDAELGQAKEKIRGPVLFSMEDPLHQMDFYVKQALDKPDGILTYDDVINSVMQIDAEGVRQVARDLFKTEMLNLAIVGPVDKKREEKVKGLLKL